jgi:hypothetical protein
MRVKLNVNCRLRLFVVSLNSPGADTTDNKLCAVQCTARALTLEWKMGSSSSSVMVRRSVWSFRSSSRLISLCQHQGKSHQISQTKRKDGSANMGKQSRP